MQEELLAKYKVEHGELPSWNTKKKLDVKPKEAPLRRKEVPALKAKILPKAKKGPKPKPKPKTVSTRKPVANLETSAEAEMPKKEETAAETPEKANVSDSGMTT